MPSLFTRIITGELPGRFVWKDERAVAFLTIAPIRPGHTLVVPRQEVDHWLDLEPDLNAHLTGVAQHVGRAIQAVWQPPKVGLMIAGLEVRHVHYHVLPIWDLGDFDFSRADADARAADLDRAAQQIRDTLRTQGHDAASA